ncbi:zinc-ribbon domain-containing protein [Phormidesmis sp. 146-33]
MAYLCDLGTGQQLRVENQGTQTIVTLTSSSTGQQQSQQSSVQTGEWQLPPTLFRTATGLILRIEAAQGHTFISLQSNSISLLKGLPSMVKADVLPLQQTSDSAPFKPMEPMKPLEPMKMGNMQMKSSPMEMRMGNMQMKMGNSSTIPSTKRFCSQCGERVGVSDRFCAHCGSQLTTD